MLLVMRSLGCCVLLLHEMPALLEGIDRHGRGSKLKKKLQTTLNSKHLSPKVQKWKIKGPDRAALHEAGALLSAPEEGGPELTMRNSSTP